MLPSLNVRAHRPLPEVAAYDAMHCIVLDFYLVANFFLKRFAISNVEITRRLRQL